MPTILSLAQFHVVIGQPQKNLSKVRKMIRQAADQGSSLILLPELWTSGYDLPNCAAHSQNNLEILKELQNLADEFALSIGGSYIVQAGERFHNTFIILSPQSAPLPQYQKIHLFRALNEFQWFIPGTDPVTVDFPWGKAGLSICYDLRFPEMFRVYARQGVKVILNVAQWGAKRSQHWRTFLRARAIENQCFVAAVNACGPLNQDKLAGCSAIIDPWGSTLVEADDAEEGVFTAKIDFDQIEQASQLVPSKEDSRFDLYKKWISE